MWYLLLGPGKCQSGFVEPGVEGLGWRGPLSWDWERGSVEGVVVVRRWWEREVWARVKGGGVVVVVVVRGEDGEEL